jgi:methionine salvage enolase-phosphatase E1
MDNPNEIDFDISKATAEIDPMLVEMIKLSERIKIFSKLRNLIYEKEYEKDEVAAHVLGWAYEKLAD